MNLSKKSMQLFLAAVLLAASPLALAEVPAQDVSSNGAPHGAGEAQPFRAPLNGIWETTLQKMALVGGSGGSYTGRLMQADPCGLSIGEEVLRGHLDGNGVFSGEIRVCTDPVCPDASPRWIYFLSLVSEDGAAMRGAVAPTSYLGCDKLFRGFQLDASKIAPLASLTPPPPPSSIPGEARIVSNPKECAIASPKGYLQLLGIAEDLDALEVDGVDWYVQPYLRAVSAGVHQVAVRFDGLPESQLQICVPGGKTPVHLDVTKAFNIAQKRAPAKEAVAGVKPKAKARHEDPKKEKEKEEDGACPRNSRKTVAIRAVNSNASVAITDIYVDGVKHGSDGIRAGGQIKLKLTVGPHAIRASSRHGSGGGTVDTFRSVCVRGDSTDTKVVF